MNNRVYCVYSSAVLHKTGLIHSFFNDAANTVVNTFKNFHGIEQQPNQTVIAAGLLFILHVGTIMLAFSQMVFYPLQ